MRGDIKVKAIKQSINQFSSIKAASAVIILQATKTKVTYVGDVGEAEK